MRVDGLGFESLRLRIFGFHVQGFGFRVQLFRMSEFRVKG